MTSTEPLTGNGKAIASAVTGVVSCTLGFASFFVFSPLLFTFLSGVGMALGFFGLRDSKTLPGHKGRWWAIAGIVLNAIFMAVIIAWLIFALFWWIGVK